MTLAQRCMIAVLDVAPQAYVSRQSAAALWGIPGFRVERVHVTRTRSASSAQSPVAVVHESRFLPGRHGTVRDGISVTTVERTIFDLAGCVHPERVERALDNALRQQIVSLEPLRRVTVELLARGRKGSRLMRQLLAARGSGYVPTGSGLEADFLALLVAAGIELPEGQVDLGADGWIGRVDFYYRHLRLVIEIDSVTFHSTKLDCDADARRDEAMRSAGFAVLRITEPELRHHPDAVVARVRAALAVHPDASGPASGRRNDHIRGQNPRGQRETPTGVAG
ncbi:MAG TPA: DUF559 domain-containing protein [Acidimicrobiales bacterium]|nr:DUF559 domain-containing protein [Acidimicrobiales bacterium]